MKDTEHVHLHDVDVENIRRGACMLPMALVLWRMWVWRYSESGPDPAQMSESVNQRKIRRMYLERDTLVGIHDATIVLDDEFALLR